MVILTFTAPVHASLDDAFSNTTFYRMLLYNDTPTAWNARTAEAYDGNATYTTAIAPI